MDLAPSDHALSGRVALVAGCAGAAGLAIAEALVAQGAHVYVAGGLVEIPRQKWRLARAGPGLCTTFPPLRTSIALSSAFGRCEQHLHILVASADAAPALALAHRDFLRRGGESVEGSAHVLAIGPPAASSAVADLSSEGIEVHSLDPELRFGGSQKLGIDDVVRSALFLCGVTPSFDSQRTSQICEVAENEYDAIPVVFPMAKL